MTSPKTSTSEAGACGPCDASGARLVVATVGAPSPARKRGDSEVNVCHLAGPVLTE